MRNKRYTQLIAVRLSPALHRRATRVAARREQRLSEFVRAALREYVVRLEPTGGAADGRRAGS